MPILPRLLKWRGWAPLLVTLGVIAAIEIGLRIAQFEFNPYGHYEKENWGSFVEGKNRVDYLPDPEVFWRFIPSRTIESTFGAGARINEHGFRGPEIPIEADKKCRRVVTLGDSGTFGWKVSDKDCYPRQLEGMLREMYSKGTVEVINAGVPGYTSLQGLRLYRDSVAKFDPDLIIVAYGSNDADKLDKADKERHASATGLAFQSALLKSRIFQWLYKTLMARKFDPRPHDSRDEVERVSIEDFANNLNEIVSIAENRGTNIILLARPGLRAEEYMDTLNGVAKARGIPLVREGIIGHPDGAGYRTIAFRVGRIAIEYELLERRR